MRRATFALTLTLLGVVLIHAMSRSADADPPATALENQSRKDQRQEDQHQNDQRQDDQPQKDQPQIVPTDGPVTYYISHCARCHGDPDTAYPDEQDQPLKQHARGDELRRMIREMSDAYAPNKLDDASVEQQVVLHNAMFDHKPYVWIDRSRADVIAGEVINGSVVETDQKTARVEAHRFVTTPDAKSLRVTLNDVTLKVDVVTEPETK